MKSSLSACIQDIQNGDREQALALLEKFSPLLKKYAFFLQSEDALPDFQCFLLAFAKNLQLNELTISTDGAIISYINKAIMFVKKRKNKSQMISISNACWPHALARLSRKALDSIRVRKGHTPAIVLRIPKKAIPPGAA